MSFSSKTPVISVLGLLFVQRVHASFLCPLMTKEQSDKKVARIQAAHAAIWVGDEVAVTVWFDANGRVIVAVPGRVKRIRETLLGKVRHRLGL